MQQDIDRFLEAIHSEQGFSPNTVVAYRNDLNQFMVFIDGAQPIVPDQPDCDPVSVAWVRSWQELPATCLTDYLRSLHDRPYATSTVARKTAAIKSFFQFLLRSGLMGEDPSVRMVPPRVEKCPPRAITPREVARLLAQPCRTIGARARRPEALRDRAMLETLYATGTRASELVSLDLADLEHDLGGGSVRCGGQSARERRVPLRESAVEAIERYLADGRPLLCEREIDALFLNHRGRRLTRQGFWLILKSYAQQAKIADVTPQTLRHTFATHAIGQGAELRHVQHLLGHVSISTTQVYRRLANSAPRREEGASMDRQLERGAV